MENPTPQPSRLKKFIRRTLFVLALLVTLIALLIAEEDWRGSRAWHIYKTTMEAKGERFDGARLIPPKVPDGENFGACPCLVEAFANTSAIPGWKLMHTNLPKSLKPPTRPGWHYGLSSDLIQWAVAFQGGTVTEKLDAAQAASIILDKMKECEPALAKLRAAASRRYCRFNLPYEHASDDLITLHLEAIKWLFGFLSLRADAELTAGDGGQALQDVKLMFRLDDGIKDEPLLISQMVRYAEAAVLLKPIAEGLVERRWSDAQLGALQEGLEQMHLIASTLTALYGERDTLANPFFDGGGITAMPRGWARLEQVNYNRAFQEVIIPRIKLPELEINPTVGRACDQALKKYPRFGNVLQHDFFTRLMLEFLSGAPKQAAAAQTDVDLLTVACALERYRLAEKTYPEQLAALSPRFIATLPHDIINGQPLKYRRTANGKFVLYSVGWNEKDDGGMAAIKKDGTQDRNQGDWVLEYPN